MPDDDEQVQYQPRYCAFIDILGFSELVTRIATDVPIRNVLRILVELQSPLPPFETEIDFEATSISDAIAISTSDSPQGLFYLLSVVHELTLGVLSHGYFTRGAIVRGLLHHHLSTVVGEALLRAIQLERDVVRYPRVLITQDVVRTLEQSYKTAEDFLRHSADGPTFLHVLRTYTDQDDLLWSSRADLSNRATCDAIRTKIIERLGDSRDNPRHFEKVQWFALYWNEVCDERKVEGMEPILLPRLHRTT